MLLVLASNILHQLRAKSVLKLYALRDIFTSRLRRVNVCMLVGGVRARMYVQKAYSKSILKDDDDDYYY